MVKYPELIAFILRAKNRKQILFLLEKQDMYPGNIAKATKMYKSHVTRALKELESKKLIQCKNPNDRSYKFYGITELGKKLLREIRRAI